MKDSQVRVARAVAEKVKVEAEARLTFVRVCVRARSLLQGKKCATLVLRPLKLSPTSSSLLLVLSVSTRCSCPLPSRPQRESPGWNQC